MLDSFYRMAFRALARIGRPIGGVRPRRMYNWLARRGFHSYRENDFVWQCDRWGSELKLSPFYLVDRDILVTGSYEEPLHRLIRDRVRPGMVCFDVGANIGAV